KAPSCDDSGRAPSATKLSRARRRGLTFPLERVTLENLPMRLGILSDIHANYEALSAVVEAFKRE
ncbi:MAG TPA: hypothetical protein VLJ38_13605, partial [Polyangiaceae bacterium]|nr:hypothetical protein [Polyangiaceae bacterium]